MAKKKHADKPGYGKLLDAWAPPEDAGEPVGCLATSFTFSPAFFEEECLARFVQMESDPDEDGPVYLIEREEKLSQSRAVALVDQHHCRGSRSLRWDLLPARMRRGLQHAKVCVLHWSRLVRLIISSANLTEDGYRRNQEVFGVLDYREGGDASLSCLTETLDFLKQAGETSITNPGSESPALVRWNTLLDGAATQAATWGRSEDHVRRDGIRVRTVFSGPGRPTVFSSLSSIWPVGTRDDAYVVSPFFDRPGIPNRPAQELWALLRQRGEASVSFYVEAEGIPASDNLLLHAPKSLLGAQPPNRPGVRTHFHRVQLGNRPLHAKGIWLDGDRWSVYHIGSSNFTSAGTGLSKASNLEANLAYLIDSTREPKARALFENAFPPGDPVNLDTAQWAPFESEDEREAVAEIPLPLAFGEAVYRCDEKQKAAVMLTIPGAPPAGWDLRTDGDDSVVYSHAHWEVHGRPEGWDIPWSEARPPSGFWVHWTDSGGNAWWPVNVSSASALPPPDELRDLPLDLLIDILTSARPLHRVLGKRKAKKSAGDAGPAVDPHKKVDTSQFLLQRSRRVSMGLTALRTRLERPAASLDSLRWRLYGPVGVMALATAIAREAKSEEERAFLLSELALELFRVCPKESPGCLPADEQTIEIRKVINELKQLMPPSLPDAPANLRDYVASVFQRVSA